LVFFVFLSLSLASLDSSLIRGSLNVPCHNCVLNNHLCKFYGCLVMRHPGVTYSSGIFPEWQDRPGCVVQLCFAPIQDALVYIGFCCTAEVFGIDPYALWISIRRNALPFFSQWHRFLSCTQPVRRHAARSYCP